VCFCCFYFFFQAEDGIRDATVTGVQTCALPICLRCTTTYCGARWIARQGCTGTRSDGRLHVLWDRWASRGDCRSGRRARLESQRSEERRVGKESRQRMTGESVEKERTAVQSVKT